MTKNWLKKLLETKNPEVQKALERIKVTDFRAMIVPLDQFISDHVDPPLSVID
jgi:hypothetical protein